VRGDIKLHCNLGQREHPFAVADKSSLVLASRDGMAIRESMVSLPPNSAVVIRSGTKVEHMKQPRTDRI
jgi:hypothetical protein